MRDAFGFGDDSSVYGLIPFDSKAIAEVGAARIVEGAVQAGALFRTVAELGNQGHRLENLILVELGPDSAALNHWIIDGWGFLRDHGMGLDLCGAKLRGALLEGAKLEHCDLSDADLSGADLSRSSLHGARLTGSMMAGACLFSASLFGADLTEADLSRADLRHADLRNSTCARATFRGADLWNAYTWHLDFSEAFTAGVDLQRSDALTSNVKRGVETHAEGGSAP